MVIAGLNLKFNSLAATTEMRFFFSGASPYPGMSSQEVINFLQDSYRMDKPKHCSEEL